MELGPTAMTLLTTTAWEDSAATVAMAAMAATAATAAMAGQDTLVSVAGVGVPLEVLEASVSSQSSVLSEAAEALAPARRPAHRLLGKPTSNAEIGQAPRRNHPSEVLS